MFKRLFVRRPPADPHEPWLSLGQDDTVPKQLAILRAKEPFRQWVKRIYPESVQSLADMRADATAYLVPLGEGEAVEAREFVKAHYGRFFAQELADWTEDASLWPAERSLALFRHWFDVEIVSMVIDTLAPR
jgi:hypothetical protein